MIATDFAERNQSGSPDPPAASATDSPPSSPSPVGAACSSRPPRRPGLRAYQRHAARPVPSTRPKTVNRAGSIVDQGPGPRPVPQPPHRRASPSHVGESQRDGVGEVPVPVQRVQHPLHLGQRRRRRGAPRIPSRMTEALRRRLPWARAVRILDIDMLPVLEAKVRPQFLRDDGDSVDGVVVVPWTRTSVTDRSDMDAFDMRRLPLRRYRYHAEGNRHG